MKIKFVGKMHQIAIIKDSQSDGGNDTLMNLKCNLIDADNCFKLYRSPLPDFYTIKSIGDYNLDTANGLYYADWGYNPDSDSFNSLIEGQTFELHDNVFGTHYKLTKSGGKWIGTNYCVNIPLKMRKENSYGSLNRDIPYISIKKNDANIFALKGLINFESGNPLKMMLDKGMITYSSNTRMGDPDETDDVWRVWFGCNEDKSGDYSATLTLDGHTYEFVIGFKSWKHEHTYEIKTDNYFEYIPYRYESFIETDSDNLRVYMKASPEFNIPIDENIEYPGGNTFEFLASTGYYSVSPRPESCTTLMTNFNIQTSGIVIGENIESHIFELNSLGNVVDIAVNDISSLEKYCNRLQKEFDDMQPKFSWFDYIAGKFVNIGSSVFTFGKVGAGDLLQISIDGIKGLSKLSFAKDADKDDGIELEDIDEVVRDKSVNQSREIIKELTYVDTIIEIPNEKYCHRYYTDTLKGTLEVETKVDNEGEVIKLNTYSINEDKSFTSNESSNGSLYEITFEDPYLMIITMGSHEPLSVRIKYTTKVENSELGLGETLTNKQLMSAAAIKKLIENHKTNWLNKILSLIHISEPTRP